MFDKPKIISIADLIRPALIDGEPIQNLNVVPADFQLSCIIKRL